MPAVALSTVRGGDAYRRLHPVTVGVERILHHIGEPTEAPKVLPARAPPQHALEFDQSADVDEWPDVDQTTGDTDDFVE